MADTISKQQVIEQLRNLGVKAGGVLLVHTAFSKVRPVEGEMPGLIDALQTTLTPQGTLVMPSMSWDDEHIFDPQSTHCRQLGIVADTFWRQPDVVRGDSIHAFAAIGPFAKHITSSHPIDDPHGLGTPVGRVYELDGQVLMLGIGQTANTTIHLAEDLAGVRYRCEAGVTIMQDGKPVWFEYKEINHCCQNFTLVDGWLDEKNLLRRGKVGHAGAILMNSQDIVNVVVEKLKANETAFLHPYGVDEECDEARASIPD